MFRTERGGLISPVRIEKPIKTNDRVGVFTEPVPHLVANIEINPAAIDLLEPELKYLTDPDWWLDQACMTVPLTTIGAKGIKSPFYWGRAIPLGYGRFKYGHQVGGMLMMKGVYRSGQYQNCGDGFIGKSERRLPIGFFGRQDALCEFDFANGLLEIDYRASLPLATISLSNTKVRKFLLDRYKDHPIVCADIEQCFEYLSESRDQLAILGRITGTESRFDNIDLARPLRRRTEFVWAANILLDELESFPQHFARYLVGTRLTLDRARAVLLMVSERRRLTEADFMDWARIYAGMAAHNGRMLRKGVERHELLSHNLNLGSVVRQLKDKDLCWLSQDFEETNNSNMEFATDAASIWLNYVTGLGSVAYKFERLWRIMGSGQKMTAMNTVALDDMWTDGLKTCASIG